MERYHGIDVNDKRVLRICRKLNIKSTVKYSNNGCTRQAANPQYIAENILNREFTAKAPNEKWLTDVTEFHYYIGMEKHKVYLSAILDLYDRRIVSYVIRDKNNNALVFDTIDNALLRNPGAQPLFHSDRGFQYTNRTFHTKLVNAGIIQSMSRVAKCIDNGPMEGFWGILKRERYYGKRFTDRSTLVKMIEDYIDYYNNKRLQRNLGTRSIASTSKIKSRLTAALVINSFESRPADLVTTVTDHPERTGRYHPYVSESLLRDIRSNHTVLGCLPLLFPQCCR